MRKNVSRALIKSAVKLSLPELAVLCDELLEAAVKVSTIMIIRMAAGNHDHDDNCDCPSAAKMLKGAQEGFNTNLSNNVRDNCAINNIPFEADPNRVLRDEIKAELDDG